MITTSLTNPRQWATIPGMDLENTPDGISLRKATRADASTIRQIISKVGINPMALDWRRFTLAVDPIGNIVGCGQVKPHADGSHELASIGVLPEWRDRGVARLIITCLLDEHPGRLYLTCRSNLGVMYQKFGFEAIGKADMPPYFRRIVSMVTFFNKLFNQTHDLLVMRRD